MIRRNLDNKYYNRTSIRQYNPSHLKTTGIKSSAFIFSVTIFLCLSVFLVSGCSSNPVYTSKKHTSVSSKKKKQPAKSTGKYRNGQVIEGIASYYGPGFHGRLTANGEKYNQNGLTCAHKHLPFGTILKITYIKTGKTVTVRVNDRGPYVKGRIIDLSVGAAKKIGMLNDGTGKVKIQIIKLGNN